MWRLAWIVELTLLALVFLAVAVPSMVCDRFGINGISMEPTLHSGEHVMVNKLLMGARIYTKYDFDDPQMECFRMPGLRRMRVGDIAVFNMPRGRGRAKIEFKINYVYAKRCIGVPGDTVSIVNGYYRNSRCPSRTIGPEARQRILAEHDDGTLLEMGIDMKTNFHPEDTVWTLKNFGPLYIPKRGGIVAVTPENLKLYERAIEYETGMLPVAEADMVRLGKEPLDNYEFRENWYFFGGDNVLNSQDSRYFGFIPEDYIVGIVF